jgi:hypothetical protein
MTITFPRTGRLVRFSCADGVVHHRHSGSNTAGTSSFGQDRVTGAAGLPIDCSVVSTGTTRSRPDPRTVPVVASASTGGASHDLEVPS